MGASEDYEKINLDVPNPNNQYKVQQATKKAWSDLIEERSSSYGHSYSGTFAEKNGVIISYFPQLGDGELETLGEMVEIIEDYPYNLFESLTESARKVYTKAEVSNNNLRRMNDQWNDKWGNALALTNGSIVIFMGMCSS